MIAPWPTGESLEVPYTLIAATVALIIVFHGILNGATMSTLAGIEHCLALTIVVEAPLQVVKTVLNVPSYY